MMNLIKQDDFLDDDIIEMTHEAFDAADDALRKAIKSRIGEYQWNRFINFFDTQDDLHSTSVEGLTKGRPKSAVKDESLTCVWFDGTYCSYSCSESGLCYFHVGFGIYIECGYSA